jgi:hypothetical protein
MKFYLAAGRLVGTQAEAKERDKQFVTHEIPTDKDGLMAYVNNLLEQIDRHANLAKAEAINTPPITVEKPEGGGTGTGVVIETPPPAAGKPPLDEGEAKRRLTLMLQGMQTEAIEEKILAARPPVLARYLSCAISRFGELGQPAFASFHALRNLGGGADDEIGAKKSTVTRIPGSEERGLRYLALGLIANLLPQPNEQKEAAE